MCLFHKDSGILKIAKDVSIVSAYSMRKVASTVNTDMIYKDSIVFIYQLVQFNTDND